MTSHSIDAGFAIEVCQTPFPSRVESGLQDYVSCLFTTAMNYRSTGTNVYQKHMTHGKRGMQFYRLDFNTLKTVATSVLSRILGAFGSNICLVLKAFVDWGGGGGYVYINNPLLITPSIHLSTLTSLT